MENLNVSLNLLTLIRGFKPKYMKYKDKEYRYLVMEIRPSLQYDRRVRRIINVEMNIIIVSSVGAEDERTLDNYAGIS